MEEEGGIINVINGLRMQCSWCDKRRVITPYHQRHHHFIGWCIGGRGGRWLGDLSPFVPACILETMFPLPAQDGDDEVKGTDTGGKGDDNEK